MSASALVLPLLVSLPGGTFMMGDDAGRADERPAHRVTVAAFRAAVRPVNNAEYDAFVAATGQHEAPPFREDPRFADDELPVAGVSWYDAVAYCEWLASVTGVAFRLPTEAEREYAARGGIDGQGWPWGDEAPESRTELRAIVSLAQPHIPGLECANAYGLRCMVDNLHEWCSDWYAPDYYASSPEDAPLGPETGRRRASRGGSWRHMIKFNRLAARSSLDPTYRYNDYGFRVYADA